MAEQITESESVTLIEVARVRWLLAAGVGIISAAVGVQRAFPGNNALQPIKAGLTLLLAAGGIYTCLLWLWSKRRLVIGETRVMLVSFRSGRVVGHIPYSQIEGVHFHHGDENDFLYNPGVSLTVLPVRGPEVFWPWLLDGETEVVIKNRFVRSPDVLRKMLRHRWQEYKRRAETAQTPSGGWAEDVDMAG